MRGSRALLAVLALVIATGCASQQQATKPAPKPAATTAANPGPAHAPASSAARPGAAPSSATSAADDFADMRRSTSESMNFVRDHMARQSPWNDARASAWNQSLVGKSRSDVVAALGVPPAKAQSGSHHDEWTWFYMSPTGTPIDGTVILEDGIVTAVCTPTAGHRKPGTTAEALQVLKGYKVGETTEPVFLNSGWNVFDSFIHDGVGIVGYVRAEDGDSVYFMGKIFKDIGPDSDLPQRVQRQYGALQSAARPSTASWKPDDDTVVSCVATFQGGKLAEMLWGPFQYQDGKLIEAKKSNGAPR